MTAYVTTSELTEYLRLPDDRDAVSLQQVCDGASLAVDGYCGRAFDKDTSATARVFRPDSGIWLTTDDFWTTSGLIVAADDADNGSWSTTWAAADYELRPLNGRGPNGRTGWPYNGIAAVLSRTYPYSNLRAGSVKVTAMWGWAAVPADVLTATYQLAALLYEMRNSPTGVQSYGDIGVMRIKESSTLQSLLSTYMRGAGASRGPLVG